MANIPNVSKLSATSVDILNAIRNSASANYRNYVPAATPDNASIRAIGNIIMDAPTLQNEFLSALVNRIGRVLITNKMFSNPWTAFKKGVLELGETIEDVFVNIAKPYDYNASTAENNVFKREIPDVRAAFHIMNYQKFYKATVQNEDLRLAFLSWDGVSNLIAKIVDAMYTGANYDEFVTMKYLLARHILNGELYAMQIPTVSTDNMKAIVSTVKGVSNQFTFPSTKYNVAGVTTFSTKDDQYIILNADFDATMDVEVLAAAFNMEKAEFMGHRVLVDSFGELDDARLNALFANEPTFKPITTEEKQALNAVPGVIVDRDWFMIFDNLYNFTEQYNGEGLYWNYWYHVWKTFSVSPFANSVVFVPGAPTVESITLSPASLTVMVGGTALISADVVTENFASKAVEFEIDGYEYAEISPLGQLSIIDGASAGDTFNVIAKSVFDPTKTATATVTVA